MFVTFPAGILLDIEGTTSSVSFVYDQMFPFVRRELHRFLEHHWDESEVQDACCQIAVDAGHNSVEEWTDPEADGEPQARVAREVTSLMDADIKATGLKQLQGLIWQSGFASGELQAHVYDDVLPCLQRWHSGGSDIRVYSSGSVHAQKLFFGHTIVGDLLGFFNGHYDTTSGNKREASSYRRIVDNFDLPARDIFFLSDIPAELDAAEQVGLQTRLVCRPGNAEVSSDCRHPRIARFTELS